MTNFAILGTNSIKLQASALVQWTQSSNQLTRTASIIAFERCHQLAKHLYLLVLHISYEDVYEAVTLIAQCISNIKTSVNGPLQKRTNILDLDWFRSIDIFYDTALDLEWTELSIFNDGSYIPWTINQNTRNIFYQKQIAHKINVQMIETIELLTSIMNIHLNTGQNMTINTSAAFMILERASFESFFNTSIEQIENARIHIPVNFSSNITNNTIISLRSIIEPLASADKSQSNTNFSRSISLSILDQYNHELPIQATVANLIELIIPRDPNLIIPPMFLENVTSFNEFSHNQLFHLKYINISSTFAISIHFEICPLNKKLAYLFIYKFDHSPILNSLINQIDEWTLFCPSNLTNDSLYTYFIDNQRTIGHQSIVYGLRELNLTEIEYFCSNQSITNPPITDERFHFTSNYEIRIYTSGCYYLDSNNTWQSDGLLVGPLTNHRQTQCYSTHLTTFTSGFFVLPKYLDWNDKYSKYVCVPVQYDCAMENSNATIENLSHHKHELCN
ncbi:unnamed protein product [Rotaria sp. Silwood1]|nr:unnamed protein product [Rotaria sp. Silwood1]